MEAQLVRAWAKNNSVALNIVIAADDWDRLLRKAYNKGKIITKVLCLIPPEEAIKIAILGSFNGQANKPVVKNYSTYRWETPAVDLASINLQANKTATTVAGLGVKPGLQGEQSEDALTLVRITSAFAELVLYHRIKHMVLAGTVDLANPPNIPEEQRTEELHEALNFTALIAVPLPPALTQLAVEKQLDLSAALQSSKDPMTSAKARSYWIPPLQTASFMALSPSMARALVKWICQFEKGVNGGVEIAMPTIGDDLPSGNPFETKWRQILESTIAWGLQEGMLQR